MAKAKGGKPTGAAKASKTNAPDVTILACKTTADADGEKHSEADVIATLAENARALTYMVGRQVLVTSTTGKTECNLARVTLQPNPEKPSFIIAKAKLKGGPALEKMVGRTVQIEIAQMELLGTAKKEPAPAK